MLAISLVAMMLVFTASPALAQDWNDRWWDDGFDFDGGLNQDVEQEAESGDVDQSFDVSNTADNSNQTAGIQGVANTGNAQNAIGVTDFGDNFNDDNDDRWWWNDWWWWNDGGFEFDEVGSSIELSPTNITSSDQEVDQAATASG